jgi:hypothetical protein
MLTPRRALARTLLTLVAVVSPALLIHSTTVEAAAATVRGAWDFEESSGTTANDSSSFNNDGTILKQPTLRQAGHTGAAFLFGTNSSWVKVPTSASLNPGASDFEVSAWIKGTVAPASGQTYDVVRKGLSTTAGGEYKLEIVPGGKVRCSAKDAARVRGVVTSTTPVMNGAWHKLACRLTGSTWAVVVDGTVRGSRSVPFGTIANSKDLAIGSKYGQEDGFRGVIDEVRLTVA